MELVFDARTVSPSSFAPPPPFADYHVRITDSEAKATTAGDGGMLVLDLEILDPGPYLNTKIPYRLNLYNKNQQTVQIAYAQLSALCHVCNVFDIRDTRQLHNIPFMATIGPQKDNPQYSNVFGVKDINGNVPGKSAAVVPLAAAPPPVAAPPVATAPPAWAPPTAAAPPAAAPWQPPTAAVPAAAPPAWPPAAPPAAAAPPTWQQAPPTNKAPWEK